VTRDAVKHDVEIVKIPWSSGKTWGTFKPRPGAARGTRFDDRPRIIAVRGPIILFTSPLTLWIHIQLIFTMRNFDSAITLKP